MGKLLETAVKLTPLSVFGTVAGLANNLLIYMNTKDAIKWKKEVLELENEHYEESNSKRPDMARLDNIGTASSCSHAQLSTPQLKNRRLRIHPNKVALYYDYKVCKRFLVVGKKCEWITDYYDLTDKKVRDRLIAMGFTVTSSSRFRR